MLAPTSRSHRASYRCEHDALLATAANTATAALVALVTDAVTAGRHDGRDHQGLAGLALHVKQHNVSAQELIGMLGNTAKDI